MFSNTAATGLSSDSESEGDEEEDDSDCITLENIPSLQLSSTRDEDDEESFGLAAEELKHKISEEIAITTFQENRDSEMEKIHNFDCKCYGRRKENSSLGTQACSRKLSPEIMYNIRIDSLAEREWQDMRIIGHLEANRRTVETSTTTTSTKKTPRKRKHCQNNFKFLIGISLPSTLADIAKVVENSSPESRLNIPQLVGLEDGRVLVNTFDWQAHLNPYFRKLPQIKSYQHFSFDAKRPDVVLARTHSNAEPVSFQLLCDPGVLPPVVCVPALPAPGLATDRQIYLYSKTRPFCS